MRNTSVKCGDIFLVNFGEGSVGHEYKKRRPAVVIQSNLQIKNSNLLTVLPLSSSMGNMLADDIIVEKDEVNLLMSRSLIKVHHIMSFDYRRIFYKIGEVDTDVLRKIRQYLSAHFDI